MNLDSMIKEHLRLLKVMKTPGRKDDAEEAKKQAKEVKGYIRKKKKQEEENEEAVYPSEVTGAP
jgi:hypothetical protein